jgi:hypothetical protein
VLADVNAPTHEQGTDRPGRVFKTGRHKPAERCGHDRLA